MNVNILSQMAYEYKHNWTLSENKPNSNPIKPNFRKAQMNVNSFITKDYRKNNVFAAQKPNPILLKAQNERKLTYNKGLQKKQCFRSPKTKPNSKPI
jgi:hypothetical protein